VCCTNIQENGANLDVADSEGRTPFHCACEQAGNASAQSVMLVLLREVDKNAQTVVKPFDDDKDTMLPTMSPDPNERQSGFLFKGDQRDDVRRRADSEFLFEAGAHERTISQISKVSSNSNALSFKSGGDKRHNSAVNVKRRMTWQHPNDNQAAKFDDTRSAEEWISSRICSQDSSGNTPLHVLASMQHTSSNAFKVMEVLLENGAQHSVNDVNLLGETPLHICALQENCCDAIELLFHHGATLDARALDGNTPLHRCCANKCFDAACLLVQFGASLDELNVSGFQPLDLSCSDILMSGVLQKRGFRYLKKWKDRVVTIRGRWMFYAELETPRTVRGRVMLDSLVLIQAEDGDPCGFVVHPRSDTDPWRFRASTPQEKHEWIETLRKCIELLGHLPHQEPGSAVAPPDLSSFDASGS
jgi:ankyrin repeat protein